MDSKIENLEKLNERIKTAENLLERVEKFQEEGLRGTSKLSLKIRAELRFLEKIKSGKITLKDDHLNSTNLTSLKALVEVAERTDNKDGILEVFHVTSHDIADCFEDKQTLVVDVVCENGTAWIKVIARNAKALLTSWEGRGGFGERSILNQANIHLEYAKENPCNFQNPRIYFIFCRGVPEIMKKDLEKIGINVRGKVIGNTEQDYCDDELFKGVDFSFFEKEKGTLNVNLDVTALLCLVSNLCHGFCNFEFDAPVLTEQATEERKSKVLPKIEEYIDGKKLYVCETALDSFRKIVDTIGGKNEKFRAGKLLERVQIVPDQPSERTLSLRNTGKINYRSKVIFGTGDSLEAVTVTANTGFVRAAAQNGVKFNVFIHDARALTEQKEPGAKMIDSSV